MTCPIKSILISILLLQPFSGTSQNYRNIQIIKVEHGLSHRDVSCVIQNSQGFIWFGTKGGLNRYDGNNFLILNTESTVVRLSGNNIRQILEDKNQNLWIVNENSIDLLNPFTFSVRSYSINTKKDGLITGVNQDKHGSIYISTTTGHIKKLINNKFIHVFGIKGNGEINYGIKKPFIDQDGSIWFTDIYVGAYRFLNGKEKLYKINGKILAAPFRNIENKLCIIGSYGLFTYDIKRDSFIRTIHLDEYFQNYFETPDGEIWIPTTKILDITGFYKKSPESGWINKVDIFDGLNETGIHVMDCISDRNKNLWITTNYGVVKVPLESGRFTNYLKSEKANKKISLRGMLEDKDGSVWIASYNKIYHLNPVNGRIDTIPQPKNPGIKSLIAYSFINDGDHLWIASEGHGIVRLNKNNYTFTFYNYFNFKKFKDAPRFLISMIKDHHGKLVFGAYMGLHFKHETKDSFYSLRNIIPEHPLNRLKINALFLSHDHKLLVGTNEGLFFLDPETYKVIKHIKALQSESINTSINCITEDQDYIWLGTAGSGLCAIDKKTGKRKFWTQKNNLSDNNISSIICDEENIWVATNNGLNVINPERNLTRQFYSVDGLSDDEFNHSSFLKSSNSTCYFGGMNGLNSFNPAYIWDREPSLTPFSITKTEYYDNDSAKMISRYTNFDLEQGIKLPYDNHYLNIHFSLADYRKQSKNQYSYFLEGYDKDWNHIGNQNNIRFLGLPAGEYILHIKAMGSNGLWSPQTINFPITAEEIFYKKAWFIVLSILFILSLGAIFLFYRLKQYKKVYALRTGLASNLHDEVGSELTLISMSSDLLKELSNDRKLDDLLDRIGTASRNAVGSMRDVIWSIDSRSDNLGSLVDKMHEYGNEMLSAKKIEFHFSPQNIIDHKKLNTHTRHSIFMIYKESINNVVKHSDSNMVVVNFRLEGSYFILKIKDNGSGQQQAFSAGQGLKNMRMRADSIKAEIEFRSEPGFEIYLKGKI